MKLNRAPNHCLSSSMTGCAYDTMHITVKFNITIHGIISVSLSTAFTYNTSVLVFGSGCYSQLWDARILDIIYG